MIIGGGPDFKHIKSLVKKFNLTGFDLVSDIEGAEIYFLENEYEILKKYCNKMIIEIHPSTINNKKIINRKTFHKYFDNIGFEIIEKDKNVYYLENNRLIK